MRKFIINFILVSVLLSTMSTSASALSCGERRAPLEELEIVDVVFRGVASKKQDGLVTFDVSMVWKGEASPHFIVQENNMWKEYNLDTEYIVYARTGNGKLFVNVCGNTKEWKAAVYDVKDFVEPRVPLIEEKGLTNNSIVIIVIVIAILLVVALSFRARKKSKK